MSEENLDIEIDSLQISMISDDFREVELKYPHLLIKNIVIVGQIKGVIENPSPDLLTVDAYGEMGDSLKYIGEIELTSRNIIMMKYYGLDVRLIKNATGSENDFSSPSSLVSIIKTLNPEDTVAVNYAEAVDLYEKEKLGG